MSRRPQRQLELAFFGVSVSGYTPTRPRCDACERIEVRTPYFATLTQDRATGLWYCDPCAFKRGLLDVPVSAATPPGRAIGRPPAS